MKIGILTNLQQEEQIGTAKEIVAGCAKITHVNDVMIFHNGDNNGEDFKSPVLDAYTLWSYSGQLIFFSALDIEHLLNIPKNIIYYYYADLDTTYEPLKLLMNKNKISVVTCNKDKHKSLKRTLGSNLRINLYENIDQILEHIT